jgi:hypothetical protein
MAQVVYFSNKSKALNSNPSTPPSQSCKHLLETIKLLEENTGKKLFFLPLFLFSSIFLFIESESQCIGQTVVEITIFLPHSP